MARANDGGPAFPQLNMVAGDGDGHGDAVEVCRVAQGGMSLRDWFAGQAMAGWLASCVDVDEVNAEGMARLAYKLADAMLARRGTGRG